MIDQLTKDFIHKISIELRKDDNQRIIKSEIMDPLFNEVSIKVNPYISILFGMYCFNLVLIIVILLIIIFKKK